LLQKVENNCFWAVYNRFCKFSRKSEFKPKINNDQLFISDSEIA